MPKSRGRHQRKGNRRTTQSRRGSRPDAADVTARAAAEFPILLETDAAEARGDAQGALHLIERDLIRREGELFWRPERLERLLQLVALDAALPRWATSRWILAQAAQTLDASTRARTQRAFAVTHEVGAQPAVDKEDLDRRAKILDHDWVFREAYLYELGGLQHFLSRVASADLVAGADRIHEWASATMGGYRLLAAAPRTLTWLDLAHGRKVETANLGAASLLEPGDCVIGRLVPVESGSMFEATPLFVPDAVARSVAADPAGWIGVLAEAGREAEGGEPAIVTSGHEFRLLTDVPVIVQRLVVLEVHKQAQSGPVRLHSVADVNAVVHGLVRAALDQQISEEVRGLGPWPSIAAAMLEPAVLARLAETASAADVPKLRRLAGLLAGPAGEWCRALADEVEEAA